MDRIEQALKRLEEELLSGLPWTDDPYTVYTARVTPGGFTADGRYFLAHTELTDEWNDPMRPWVTEKRVLRGVAMLDAETGEVCSHKTYEHIDCGEDELP